MSLLGQELTGAPFDPPKESKKKAVPTTEQGDGPSKNELKKAAKAAAKDAKRAVHKAAGGDAAQPLTPVGGGGAGSPGVGSPPGSPKSLGEALKDATTYAEALVAVAASIVGRERHGTPLFDANTIARFLCEKAHNGDKAIEGLLGVGDEHMQEVRPVDRGCWGNL